MPLPVISRHGKIAIGWAVGTFAGLYMFYLSKSSVDKRRYENMKIRERMKLANFGEYEVPTRFSKD